MNQYKSNVHPDPGTETESLNAIVVGTGRSGSTMLSNLFREHPAILSLSEFFRLLSPAAFGEEVLDGAQFWEIIGSPALHLSFFLQQEVPMPEFLYPFKSPHSRFTGATSVPPILLVSLPHLTGDYEALYDELRLVVLSFPSDRIVGHFDRLFSWLKRRFGRSACIERSGLSLPIVPLLTQMFPRTKFIHLVRDGRACAWSMSCHFAFRFMVSMQIPIEPSAENAGEGERQQAVDMNRVDFTQILALPIPLENFGRFWSRLIITGVQALMSLPEEQLLTIRYEDIIDDPQSHLARLIDFINPALQDTGWLERAGKLIEQRPSGWEQLPAGERDALERACEPGQAVLDLVLQEGMYSPRLAELLQQLA